MPVLPFHRYIGPGNPTDNGEPVDEDDRIAKIHDVKYDEAKTNEDIRKADVEAITQFRRNWRDGNWHSLIGDAGLSIKYFVESYTGVLYPKLSKLEIEHNCEIVHIKNLLKLHCVFKNRPFLDKYESNVLAPSENLDYSTYDFVTQRKIDDSSLSPFVYVPLEWTELYLKYCDTPLIWNNCVFCAHNFCDSEDSLGGTSDNKKYPPINNNNKIKYDIFNFDFWLNIALMRSLKKYKHEQENKFDEDLYELDIFKMEQ